MDFTKLMSGIAIAIAVGVGGTAFAETEAGENEFMQACAACHGLGATGNGPVADLLKVDVPDLTMIARHNDGEFPMLRVIQIIDGRSGIRGHGGIMPIWGDRFEAEAIDKVGEFGAEMMVRGRILALAQYLESIQK